MANVLLAPFSSLAAIFADSTANNQCHYNSFFGLKPWYYYLNVDKSCQISQFNPLGNGANSDFLLIALAIVDDLLVIAGLVAVGFVIYAGIKYITSQGSPEETAKAHTTLLHALIGLAGALVAVGLVSFLGHNLGGASGGSPGVGSLPQTTASQGTVQALLQIVFGLAGALAFLFVVIGGFRYVISQGDPQATAKAKSTILYALIGLAVAILAESIVSFVIGSLG